jgi:uncharacterized protein (TIGR00251 family)
MKEAVRQTSEGVVLDLEISPGAKENAVRGYNPWRKRIEVRLSERAQKGKANEQLISFLSDLFHINSRDVRIITGPANSKKSLLIIGAKMPEILKLLKENEHKNF